MYWSKTTIDIIEQFCCLSYPEEYKRQFDFVHKRTRFYWVFDPFSNVKWRNTTDLYLSLIWLEGGDTLHIFMIVLLLLISFNYKMNKFKTNFILIISACYSITLMCYSIIFRCSSIIFGHQLQYNHYDIVFRFQVLWHHFRDFWHRFQVLLNSVKYLHGLHLLLSNQNAVIVLRSI